jgi:hypothetical protein
LLHVFLCARRTRVGRPLVRPAALLRLDVYGGTGWHELSARTTTTTTTNSPATHQRGEAVLSVLPAGTHQLCTASCGRVGRTREGGVGEATKEREEAGLLAQHHHRGQIQQATATPPRLVTRASVVTSNRPRYSLRLKKSDVFDFQTSCLTDRLIQKFYVNYKINKSLLKYL